MQKSAYIFVPYKHTPVPIMFTACLLKCLVYIKTTFLRIIEKEIEGTKSITNQKTEH